MIRRKSNRIECLKLDNNEWIYSRCQIANLFSTRFENIFDSPLPSDCDLSGIIDPVILDDENLSLMRIPSWEEIRKPNPSHPNHFRPISVCNVAYRIISKILANRLKPILDKLICPIKNSFIFGRSIHENSILLQEAIHSMKKKKDARGWMALKIDLEKAYDWVSWEFVERVLKAFGFNIV
ncbi:hypothetical protein UlMin_020270 [Ulmus minor]